MAEGRMIKKRIAKSHKFAALKTNNARLLYLMIYPHLDIKGRIDANPALIKGEITPLLSFSQQKVQEYLEDMHNVGLIKLYQSNGQWFAEFIRFTDFQILRADHEGQSQCPDPTTEQPREDHGRATAQGKERKGKENKGKESKKEKTKHSLSQRDKDFILKNRKHYLENYGVTPEFMEAFFLQCEAKNYKYADFGKALLVWARKDGLKKPGKKDSRPTEEVLKERGLLK